MQYRVRLVDEASGAIEVVRLGRVPVAPGELTIADLAGVRRFEVVRVSRDDSCDAIAVVRTVELRLAADDRTYRGIVARTPAHGTAREVIRRRLAG